MTAEPSQAVILPFDTERQKRLHICDNPECMKLRGAIEALTAQTEEMAVDMHNQARDLKAKNRQITRLEHEIERLVRGPDAPDHKKAERIFEFWREVTGRSNRTMFDVDREKAILHALKLLEGTWGEDLAPRVLCCAILGCARLHHTDPHTKVKYTEVKMVCRNAEMIEKNLQRYFSYCAQTNQQPVIERLEG